MCGRYVRRSDKQKLVEHFHAQPNPAELPLPDADYNVAPTTHRPTIRQSRETGDRELILACWGLVPFFTKDLKDIKGLSTINACSETITGRYRSHGTGHTGSLKTWNDPAQLLQVPGGRTSDRPD